MCPFQDKPDCFNCPLDDCKADTHETTKQDSANHGKKLTDKEKAILNDYQKGVANDAILMRYNTSISRLKQILKRAGIEYTDNNRITKW